MTWIENELAHQDSWWQSYGETNWHYLKRVWQRVWRWCLKHIGGVDG